MQKHTTRRTATITRLAISMVLVSGEVMARGGYSHGSLSDGTATIICLLMATLCLVGALNNWRKICNGLEILWRILALAFAAVFYYAGFMLYKDELYTFFTSTVPMLVFFVAVLAVPGIVLLLLKKVIDIFRDWLRP